MSTNEYGRNRLPYPYSYLTRQVFAAPELNTGADFLSDYSDNFNFYVLVMTPDEQREFSSALMAGADLIYPSTQVDVQGQWLYAREYPNDLTGGGLVPLSTFCNYMSQCLDQVANGTNASLALSLRNAVSTTNNIADNRGDTPLNEYSDENLASGIAGCNNDTLYGGIVELIEYVEVIARDILESVVAEVVDKGRVLVLIDAIPLLGDVPVGDDLTEWVNYFALQGLTSFDAGISQADNEALACYIYERACQECEITTDIIMRAYADRIQETVDLTQSISAWIDLFLGNSGDSIFAYGLCGVVAAALSMSGEVAGFSGLQTVKQIISTADPDPDWQFCNPCGGQLLCYADDFAQGQGAWLITFESRFTGSGFASKSPNFGRIWFRRPSPETGDLVQAQCELSQPMNGNRNTVALQVYADSSLQTFKGQLIGTSTDQNITLTGSVPILATDQLAWRFEENDNPATNFAGQVVNQEFCIQT